MKALTICQPHAHYVYIRDKVVENRTWATSYRGELAIHAGKSRDWLEADDLAEFPDMVFGAIVALATLADCVTFADLPESLRLHPHANGPWCWILEDVQPLKMPVVCSGAQGLWTVDPARAADVRRLAA